MNYFISLNHSSNNEFVNIFINKKRLNLINISDNGISSNNTN